MCEEGEKTNKVVLEPSPVIMYLSRVLEESLVGLYWATCTDWSLDKRKAGPPLKAHVMNSLKVFLSFRIAVTVPIDSSSD